MTSHRYESLYLFLLQIVTKQLYFSYMEDILIEKRAMIFDNWHRSAAMLVAKFPEFHAGTSKFLYNCIHVFPQNNDAPLILTILWKILLIIYSA